MQIRRRAGSDVIRWVPPGEIALLLATVGEVSPATMARIEPILAGVASRHAPMVLTVSGAGGSPNATMPKSAWLGLAGDVQRMTALRQDVVQCIGNVQTAMDEKPFEPVVEIGALRRFDDRARTEMGRALKMATVGEIGSLRVDAIHLLASRSSTSGPTLHSVLSQSLTVQA